MAIHTSANIYGELEGTWPYINSRNSTIDPSRIIDYGQPILGSFPNQTVEFLTIVGGLQMPVSGAYVYSIINVPPSGLNVHGQQLVTDQTVAQLATAAG